MAVAFDAKLNDGGVTYVRNTSYTLSTGSAMAVGPGNTVLLVAVASNGGWPDSVIRNPGGFQQDLTLLGRFQDPDGIVEWYVSLYGLVNPTPAGSAEVQVIGNTTGDYFYVSAISFKNASGFARFVSGGGGSSGPTITVSSAAGNMAAGFFFTQKSSGATVVSNSPTQWFRINDGYTAGGGSYTSATTGTSKTLNIGLDSSVAWISVGIDIVAGSFTDALTATSKAVGAPTIGAPVMVAVKTFIANSFAVPPPTITTAAFVQNYAFTGTPLTTKPVFGTGLLAQTHGLGANGYAVNPPTFSLPGLFLTRVFASPPPLSVGIPSFTTSAFGQIYALTAAWFPRQPLIDVGQLAQKQILPNATNLAVSNPALGAASTQLGRQLVALDAAAAAPVFAAVTPIQIHALGAGGLAVIAPAFSRPAFSMVLALVAPPLAVAQPTFSSTGVDRNNFLPSGDDLIIGGPTFSPPSLGELLPPLVWLRHRLKRWSNDPRAEYYDEDGTEDEGPVKQAIFANLNDEIELTISTQTLVGRTSPGRGPAELILAAYPLYLLDRTLRIDWTDVELLVARVNELEARVAALEELITEMRSA